MTTKHKIYQYTITLTKQIWPRKLADILSSTEIAETLVAVTDEQNDTHIYGDTYKVGHARDFDLTRTSRVKSSE
jgi:hypothetical protein